MNMFKKTGGFTLVELIVVIAILAILAGIAVPAYSGYIARAEETKDIAKLEAIQTAALAAASLNGVTESGAIKVVTDDSGNVTNVSLNDKAIFIASDEGDDNNPAPEADFEKFITTADLKLELDVNKNATITEITTGWTAATTTGE